MNQRRKQGTAAKRVDGKTVGIAKRSQVSSVEKSQVCAADGKDWGSLCVGLCGGSGLCSLAEALFGLSASLTDDRHVLAIGTDDGSTFFARA